MSRLDAIRARGLTSHQLRLLAKASGDYLLAAEADAQAVRERIQRGPRRPTPAEPTDTPHPAANVLKAAFPRAMNSIPTPTKRAQP